MSSDRDDNKQALVSRTYLLCLVVVVLPIIDSCRFHFVCGSLSSTSVCSREPESWMEELWQYQRAVLSGRMIVVRGLYLCATLMYEYC